MILEYLSKLWIKENKPFYIDSDQSLTYKDISKIEVVGIDKVQKGDVVSLIGDFDPESICTLLSLIEAGCIVVPLTTDTEMQHQYFFNESRSQFIFRKNKLEKIISLKQIKNPLLDNLRLRSNPGLILFTTGTTGKPKAILHDFVPFISRYKTPRPPLKALSFLLFDHIGGINTLLHMLFNLGCVVSIKNRTIKNVINTCNENLIELLPTTPTFLRLLSLYPNIEKIFPKSIKIVSYGTERLDQPTLDFLCSKLPAVDFRQTYGMSELGILRIKSLSRNSLFMKVSGEGVETKIIKSVLYIRSKNKMEGYLNSDSPFDEEGWYCTKDIVETRDEYLKIIGRDSDVINVGGLKFMPSEVEKICLEFEGVIHAKAIGRNNPITGQHVELIVEKSTLNFDEKDFDNYLRTNLQKHMMPMKIIYKKLELSHRYKKK